MSFFQAIPYCGLPPSPASLLWRWRLDPIVLVLLTGALALYMAGAVKGNAGRTQQACFYGGWTIGALALVSPLCPLSVSLFAARAAQHVLITLVAAPLIVAGRPLSVWRTALGAPAPPRAAPPCRAILAAIVFTPVVWLWHTPGLYALTFQSSEIYWAMHVTMFVSAYWLWSELFQRGFRSPLQEIGASLISSVQMGFLGAIITLSPRAFYTPHEFTTWAWGLTQLQDQQMGGAIMWGPGCAVFLAASVFGLARTLSGRDWDASAHAQEAHS